MCDTGTPACAEVGCNASKRPQTILLVPRSDATRFIGHRQECLCYFSATTVTLRRLITGLQGRLGHVAVADST